MEQAAKRPRGRPFQKGQSGNPAGPRRRPRSLRKLVVEGLDETIDVTENGKTRRYTKKRLFARQTVDDAIQLKPTALKTCIDCLTMQEYQDGEKTLSWGPMIDGRAKARVSYSENYTRTMAELITEELEVNVAVRQSNGRNRYYTKRELLANALVNGSLRKRTAAIRQLLAILCKPDLPDSTEPVVFTLKIGDKVIKE